VSSPARERDWRDGWLRDAGRDAAGRPLDRMMSWTQVIEAAGAGVEIGAHSHSHPQLDQLTVQELRSELSGSRARLEDRLDHPVASLAYPYGYSSPRVRELAAEVGYRQAAGVANEASTHDDDMFAVPRLTIRRSTTDQAFSSVAAMHGLRRRYAVDHLLTAGYSIVRRARSLTRRSAHPR